MSATFELKPDDDPAHPRPSFVVGGTITKILVPLKNGTKAEFDVDADNRIITLDDERAIRALKVDPRFTLVSED